MLRYTYVHVDTFTVHYKLRKLHVYTSTYKLKHESKQDTIDNGLHIVQVSKLSSHILQLILACGELSQLPS